MSTSSAHDPLPEPTSRVRRRRASRMERVISSVLLLCVVLGICATVLFFEPIAEASVPLMPGVVREHPLAAGLLLVVALLAAGTAVTRVLSGRLRWIVQVLCLLGAIGATVVTGSLILASSQETRDLAPGAPEVCGQTLDSCEHPAQVEGDDS